MNKSYMIGYRFQRRVKKYLEKDGWSCIVQPRSKFPDIVAWNKLLFSPYYELYLIECKVNKYLTKEEKKEALNLLDKKVCNKFIVAYRDGHKLKFYELDEKLNKQEVVL